MNNDLNVLMRFHPQTNVCLPTLYSIQGTQRLDKLSECRVWFRVTSPTRNYGEPVRQRLLVSKASAAPFVFRVPLVWNKLSSKLNTKANLLLTVI